MNPASNYHPKVLCNHTLSGVHHNWELHAGRGPPRIMLVKDLYPWFIHVVMSRGYTHLGCWLTVPCGNST